LDIDFLKKTLIRILSPNIIILKQLNLNYLTKRKDKVQHILNKLYALKIKEKSHITIKKIKLI
jgi:hypothetical protein